MSYVHDLQDLYAFMGVFSSKRFILAFLSSEVPKCRVFNRDHLANLIKFFNVE